MKDNNFDDDDQNINPDNLDVLQDEASNYNTDSDIDDPKYTPTYTSQNKDRIKTQPKTFNPEVLTKTLEDKIRFIRNDNEFKNKNLIELENENNLLKTELLKLKDNLDAKDAIIGEFNALTEKSTEKFRQLEEKNDSLKKTNDNLLSQISDYENQVKLLKLKNDQYESNTKNISLYQEHINELQNEYAQKEMKLNRKYQEKENSIKNEFIGEITKLTKELEELRAENGKLKFDVSNLKINIQTINSQNEDKEYEHTAIINKKDKEIKKLKDRIEEYDKKANDIENYSKEKETIALSEIEKLKEDNDNLTTELNRKNESVFDLEAQLENLTQNFDSLSNQIKESKIEIENKSTLIEQLKNQNEELQKEIAARDNELELLDQNKQKDNKDYNEQVGALIKEKNHLEMVNAELSDNLGLANQKIKEFNDFITDKYNSLKQTLYKETTKNENLDKKYKGIIKQLKMKEKKLFEENKSLKDLLNEKDIEKEQMEYHYQNELKNVSLYNNVNNSNVLCQGLNGTNLPNSNVNNSMAAGYNMNSNFGLGQPNTNFNVNSSYYGLGVGNNTYRFEDPKEEGQKRTLEEFKRLLNKIDEKLDLPVKQN